MAGRKHQTGETVDLWMPLMDDSTIWAAVRLFSTLLLAPGFSLMLNLSSTLRHRCWFALVSLAILPAAGAGAAEDRPNILFIYLDDFGWRDTTYMGSDFYETPQLDQLAKEGMIFTNAYSCAANCAPARACLLSGQYTPRHEIYNVGTRPRGAKQHRRLMHVPGVDTLDRKIRTWAHQLHQAGYRTGTIGKWHLSNDPLPYGFDVNIGGTHSGSPPRGYYPPHPAPGLKDAPQGEYLTDRLTEEAIDFIGANRERPWALYLTHFAVHTPLNAKQELLPKYQAKPKGKLHDHVAMATMVQAVDDGVGKIQAALQRWSLEERTIVIFSSDNGGYGPATDMDPLKGYKGAYYEGGIRVPLFVKWPGVVEPGSKSESPVIQVDVFPTLCEMTGADKPDQPLDGKSLVPLLKQTADAEQAFAARPIFWHFPAYLQSYGGAYRMEQRDPLFRSRPCSIIRLGDWKLHHYYEDNGFELYNLREDIGESRELSLQHPDQLAVLKQKLQDWKTALQAPVPTTPNPDFDADAEAAAKQKAMKRAAKRGS